MKPQAPERVNGHNPVVAVIGFLLVKCIDIGVPLFFLLCVLLILWTAVSGMRWLWTHPLF